MNFIPSMDHQKEFHYTGTNGKLLPLYKEASRSSERLGSLFPGDDVLAYGIAVNLDKSEGGDIDDSGINISIYVFWISFSVYVHSHHDNY
jgi:hypothetical protein